MATQPSTNKLKIANPPLENNVRTYLSSDVSSSGTTLPATSSTGFPGTSAADYYGIVGDYCDENAEIKLIDTSATTATQFTCAALSYAHSASTPITYIGYDKINIYGATTSGGTKNLIASVDIDVTEQYTEYTYVGSTYSYFYTAYFQSDAALDIISEYSDEIVSTTFTRYSVKNILDSGARKAMTNIDENKESKLNWDIAVDVLQDGVDEILARKRKWSFLKTRGTTTTTSGDDYVTKPSDIAQLLFLKIDDYIVEWISLLDYNRYTESGETQTGRPAVATDLDDKWYIHPQADSTYDVEYDYYKDPVTITSLASEVSVPFKTVLIYYCASQFAYIRGNDKRGDKWMTKFGQLLEQQVIEYSGPEQDGFADAVEHTNINNMIMD